MRIRTLFPPLLLIPLYLLLCCSLVHGQAIYSYVDKNGVRTFTNIPPKKSPKELKISGQPVQATATLDILGSDGESEFDSIIEKYAVEYSLDPTLIRSIIATESAFNPKAVSPKGARGLMQLMPATAASLGVRDSFDPEQNIRGGTKHFRTLLDTFDNDLELSLAAYNAGENLVQRIGRIPNIRETKNYVKSITNRYGKSQMELQHADSAKITRMYRYRDSYGVLHLTNIPPVEQPEAEVTAWKRSEPPPR
jgi:hypothetical protein